MRPGVLDAICPRVRDGVPYVGIGAGPIFACPSIRTTNDTPVVEPVPGYDRVTLSYRGPLIERSPQILGGTPVFRATRVPVQALFDYLEGGHSLDEFLDEFPTVAREDAIAVLEVARESLITRARPS